MIKHLEVKRAYYNDPENLVVEYNNHIFNEWVECVGEPIWSGEAEYRIKPRTIRIGEIDVPEPVRKPLQTNNIYYRPCTKNGVIAASWWGDTLDLTLLRHNMVHLTCEAAELHAKSLILVSGGRVE